MKIDTLIYENDAWKEANSNQIALKSIDSDLVLVFGDTDVIKEEKHFNELKNIFQNSIIVGCSTSGNILFSEVSDCKLTATSIKFDNAYVKSSSFTFNENDNLEELSKKLIEDLKSDDLKHIFIISEGLLVNGSSLTKGFNKLSENITITGGLAGDGDRFQETYVIANSSATQRTIVAIGFYGDSLTIGSGCFSGWSEFGTERIITKSEANIVYEIDGKPALDLYKKYLGELADELPFSGIRFPLNIKASKDDNEVIRTLLAIDEEKGSITYAGDVPEGYIARLMKADIDLLIDGAGVAAESIEKINDKTALGLIVSCVGRKIVMNQLIDDELEIVQDVLGENVILTGFYSYGEIAPFKDDKYNCQLHNQTMTITTIYED